VVKDLDPFELGDGEIGENGCLWTMGVFIQIKETHFV